MKTQLFILCGLLFLFSHSVDSQQLLPSVEQNFIVHKIYQNPLAESSNNLNDVQVEIDYYDGLGRPMQTVLVGASPDHKDIITPIIYDELGRETQKYLPYEAGHVNGAYNPNALSAQDSFYKAPSTSTVKDNFPYAQTVFEPSPLNRVVKQGSYGGDWHPDYGRTARIWYNSNTLNEVPLWKITDNGAATMESYPAATLYRTDLVDENNHLRYEYKDLQGRIVRTSCEKPGGMAQTTYIYNYFGELAFVIPDTVTVTSFTKEDEIFSKFIYAYEYDDRRQVIRKHVPSSGWTTIVYNFRKLPVMTQTAEQKERNEWNFTKYDALGRMVMTGVLTDSRSFEEITADARQFAWPGTSGGPCREVFDYFDPNFTGGAMGYSNCSFPYQVPEANIKAAYYYDNYDFNLDGAPSRQTESCDMTQGFQTGSKVRILPDGEWLTTINYYDRKGRGQEVINKTIKNTWDRVVNEHDFTGKLIASTRTLNETVIRTEQRYDHASRPTDTRYLIGAGDTVITTRNEYNELGQLLAKKLHSADGGATWLQEMDYTYNIHGWLLTVNDGENPGGKYMDVFSMRLIYNDAVTVGETTTVPQFNGNIASMRWKTKGMGIDAVSVGGHAYAFQYDVMERLTGATYARDTMNNRTYDLFSGRYDEAANYGVMGNIRTLNRSGVGGQIDNLTYTYDGHQVKGISDGVTSELKKFGYKDSVALETEYVYDAAGRMHQDMEKGITVEYNYLNLPYSITNGQHTLIYTYLADGRRVKKSFNNVDRYYIDGFEYEGDNLQFITMPEGRIRPKADGSWVYDYFIKDHLGNVRVVLTSEQAGTQTYMATMEENKAGEENTYFNNVDATRADRPYNYPDNNPLNTKLAKVPGKSKGPSIMLKVMAGDTIEISAKAFYNMDKTLPGQGVDIAPVLGSAVAAMASSGVSQLGESAKLLSDLGATASQSVALSQVPKDDHNETSPQPTAGINFVLYNANFDVVPGNTGTKVVEDKINKIQTLATDKMVIQENGFLEVFVKNDAQTPVFFDNLILAHTLGTVLEVNSYYPYGMLMEGADMGFQAAGSTWNGYKYNAKELQKEMNLGWLDYGARMYDPAVSRWWVPDPLAEKYYNTSPYAYCGNNPISRIDPDGKAWWFIIAAIVGLITESQPVNAPTLDSEKNNQAWSIANKEYGIGIASNLVPFGPAAAPAVSTRVAARQIIKSEIKREVKSEIKKEITQSASEGSTKGKLNQPADLPDEAIIVRGGQSKAANFENGTGVTVDGAGNLNNVSVNSQQGATIETLTNGIPNGKVGTTTVGTIRASGGNVTPSPTNANPTHATMSGVTPQTAEELFNPVIDNPNRKK